ncbi:MAG: hypothetical protein KME27_00930 [Lyngbya sp. HA4199-MV5]|nr:hypothetical protein [Lyngbya sp. HA4199-MV5]
MLEEGRRQEAEGRRQGRCWLLEEGRRQEAEGRGVEGRRQKGKSFRYASGSFLTSLKKHCFRAANWKEHVNLEAWQKTLTAFVLGVATKQTEYETNRKS